MISISKEFHFDAAHYLPTAAKGHPNSRMHGHSFTVVLTLEAAVDPVKGWIRDFAEIDGAIAELRARLDHHTLNDIEGLEVPTLENVSRYIFDASRATLPELAAVTVKRGTLGESCTYRKATP